MDLSKYVFRNCLVILIVISFNNIVGQSDYQLTRNFKSTYDSLKTESDTSTVLNYILDLQAAAANLRKEYQPHKKIIDQAYYPLTFEKMFDDLGKQLNSALLNAQRISSLGREVKTLKKEKIILTKRVELLLKEVEKQNKYLNNLIQRNSRLAAELKLLKGNPPEDKRAKDSLLIVVKQLKENLIARDNLVKSILDSLFLSSHYQVAKLTDTEKRGLAVNIKKIAVIENVKQLILDNVEFLEALSLEQGDLKALKSEYIKFSGTWEKIGNDVAKVYAGNKNYKDELAEINILLHEWGATIDLVTWRHVVNVFHSKKINVKPFTSGNDFQNNFIDYIDGQIRQIEMESEVIHYNNFKYFSDVWDDSFILLWQPFLISNNLLVEQNVDAVKYKLNKWEKIVNETTPWWIYLIVIAVMLFLIVIVWNFLSKRGIYKA